MILVRGINIMLVRGSNIRLVRGINIMLVNHPLVSLDVSYLTNIFLRLVVIDARNY